MTSWRADQFDLLPQSVQELWSHYGTWPNKTYFPNVVGIEVEELRRDYARMRLPWREELNQPQGLMHAGAIATLIDTVVVPAIGTAYNDPRSFSTIEMSVRYLDTVRQEDLVAEGWVTKRGRKVVFCEVEVRTATAVKVATLFTMQCYSQSSLVIRCSKELQFGAHCIANSQVSFNPCQKCNRSYPNCTNSPSTPIAGSGLNFKISQFVAIESIICDSISMLFLGWHFEIRSITRLRDV